MKLENIIKHGKKIAFIGAILTGLMIGCNSNQSPKKEKKENLFTNNSEIKKNNILINEEYCKNLRENPNKPSWDSIAECFETLLESDPDNHDYWIEFKMAYNQGGRGKNPALECRAKFYDGNIESAVKCYENFLKSNKGSIEDWDTLAAAYFKSNRSSDAIDIITKKLIKSDPKNPSYWNNIALIYCYNQDRENARFAYSKTVELSSPNYYFTVFSDCHSLVSDILEGKNLIIADSPF